MKALQAVKLNPPTFFANKYPHMLSGGQRQRVAIARSLILNPEFILADEPVSMLDASVRISILRLLRQIQQQFGIAFLYITHDLATAKHFADRIGIMYAGRLVEEGPVGSVLGEPLHPYAQALMGAIPDPDPANRLVVRQSLPGEPPNLVDLPTGCHFHPRCPIAQMGLCDVKDPELRDLRPGHRVACHLATERIGEPGEGGRLRRRTARTRIVTPTIAAIPVPMKSAYGGEGGGADARRKETVDPCAVSFPAIPTARNPYIMSVVRLRTTRENPPAAVRLPAR